MTIEKDILIGQQHQQILGLNQQVQWLAQLVRDVKVGKVAIADVQVTADRIEVKPPNGTGTPAGPPHPPGNRRSRRKSSR